jgi:hypothetical protein
MANREMANNIKIVQALAPALRTTNNTTVAGAAVDTQGYDSATFVADFGAWGDTTTGGWECGVQHSDDTVSGNFEDVPDNLLSYSVAGDHTVTGASDTGVFVKINAQAEASNVYTTSYLGNKRYVRPLLAAEGNNSNGTPCGINVLLGHPHRSPTGANKAST